MRSQGHVEFGEGGFDRAGDEPSEAGRDRARGFERGDQIPLRPGRQRVDQRVRRAQQALREKRGIDNRLTVAREVHEIGRGGITARAIASRVRSA